MKSAEIPAPEGTQKKKRTVTVILQILFSVAILGCGVALATYFLRTGPEAKPRKVKSSPPLVQVTPVTYGSHQLTVGGMGIVLAAKEINLTPGVGGEIIAISDNMVPGGFFTKDETLVNIDPIDYKLAIMRLQSEVAKAQNDLQLEMGNQRIARKEYEILGQKVSKIEKKLMLRDPQLGITKATLQGVKATLAQAELNLKRTQVHAPFNGVVLSRSVNFGTRITESTVLARLVGTDEFWLKLAIPTDQLRWITFPSPKGDRDGDREGSKVRIYLQAKENGGSIRRGQVIRLAADVEDKGRMASVYVAIKDPLCQLPENSDKPKLLLGSFVRAEIEGTELTSVVPINRDYLRENNSIWLIKDDNTLEIREVKIVAKTKDQVLVGAGLKNGELLIVSGLSSPIAGSPVQLQQKGKAQPGTDRTAAESSRTTEGAISQ
ncbi:MAG: efflux RND transporter periplasmic adaptor subunit [Desulfobulbaceae bacterium]|nr:efflux RND transporter periplasmic adaptor subunit [Desulfobulbaceae bacterium]